MIVKIPEQRQFSDTDTQKRFNDLVSYLLERFEASQVKDFMATRYGAESDHDIVSPGFSDILNYAADLSSTDHSNIGASQTDRSASVTSASAPSNNPYSELDKSFGGKCIAVETHGVTHLVTAIAEMNAVAAKNTRVKDPAYHFILSWPEHEKPDNESVFQAARHAISSLGLSTHQYVIAIHGNTDNLHCHIAVNRVNPVTFKSKHLSYSWRTLHYAARESEIEHGWSHDDGIYIVALDEHGQKVIVKNPDVDIHNKYDSFPAQRPREGLPPIVLSKDGTSQKEPSYTAPSPTAPSPWTDPDSLINWVRSTIVPVLKPSLPAMTSWQELHTFLTNNRLALKDTGGGGMRLTAVDADTGELLDVPASKALRLLKRKDLEARWGPFQAPSSTPTPQSESPASPKEVSHAEDLTRFDEFDEYAPRPEIARRRQRMRELRGQHVDGDESPELAMLLQGDASHSLEHIETELHHGLRHPREGTTTGMSHQNGFDSPDDPSWTPSTKAPTSRNALLNKDRSTKDPYTNDPYTNDPYNTNTSRVAFSTRDPSHRAQRREQRLQDRLALRRRYHEYRHAVMATNAIQRARNSVVLAGHRKDRQTQHRTFTAEKQHLRKPRRIIQPELAILAAGQSLARQRLTAVHLAQRQALNAQLTPLQPWREWLLQEAQKGDKAALSALRGIVYQAKRDGKWLSSNDASPGDPSSNGISSSALSNKVPSDRVPSTTGTSKEDESASELSDYYALLKRLKEEEKRELAIRGTNPRQARPYECDPLLIRPANMTYRVTGNGNVQFFDLAEHHLFTDRGNRLTFDRKLVTDDELRLALLHAREKFGNRLTLTGEDPIFLTRMARMADDLGMRVINPELASIISEHRQTKTPSRAFAPPPTPTTLRTPDPIVPAQPSPPQESPSRPTPASLSASENFAQSTPSHVDLSGNDTPQLGASTTSPLPQETAIERLRQAILTDHPTATFITVDPAQPKTYIGRIVATDADAFVQRVGRSTFALHLTAAPSEAQQSKKSATIEYRDGQPFYQLGTTKSKGRTGGR